MITNTLIIIAIAVIVYLLLGFSFLAERSITRPQRASIFNQIKKNIYPTSLEERLAKNVITREEYEWIKSDRYDTPIGGQEEY
jgi:uncharacterized membrane protein